MTVQNCLKIIKILNTNSKSTTISAQQLATLLGVSTRTVYRYIEELIIAGIPINIQAGRLGGFSLDEAYRKDKYKITV